VSINPRSLKPYGFFGCIPEKRIGSGSHQRSKEVVIKAGGAGLKGVLGKLLRTYPEIERELRTFVLTRSFLGGKPIPLVGPSEAHAAFLTLAEEHGVTPTEWPFAVEGKGEKAIYEWFERLRAERPSDVARSERGDEAAAKIQVDCNAASSGRPKPPPPRCYQVVQLDAHDVDALFTVAYPAGSKLMAYVTYVRIWFLSLIEQITGAILASTVAYGTAVRAEDVFRLFRRALWPPGPYDLPAQHPSLRYVKGAMYPGEISELRGLSFGEVKWDRASVHLHVEDTTRLERVVGCHFTHGPPAFPMDRPHIENWFGILERHVHRLPITTGSNPQDPCRRNPEAAAKLLKLSPAWGSTVLDVVTRNHNAAVGLANIPRIQHILEMKAAGEMFVSKVGNLRPANGHHLLPSFPVTVVRSRGDSGPLVVNFEYGAYSSHELKGNVQIASSSVRTGTIFPKEDARDAYFVADAVKDRVFDLNQFAGPFSDVPHTLEARRAATCANRNFKRAERASSAQMFLGLSRELGTKAEDGDAQALDSLQRVMQGMVDVSAHRYSDVDVARNCSVDDSPSVPVGNAMEISDVSDLLAKAATGTLPFAAVDAQGFQAGTTGGNKSRDNWRPGRPKKTSVSKERAVRGGDPFGFGF
jgi:hypothetical protein